MPNGGTYYVRALTTDEKGLSAGSWSSWTTIRRAGTAPVAPSISCPGYANGSWTSADPATDVTCTVATSGSGVLAATRLDIYVDGAATPTKSVDAKQTATSTTVVIPRTARGGHSVRAVAVGGANLSSTTTSTFGWGPASMVTPVNGATTSGRVRVTATGTATNVKPAARVQWRLAGTGSTGWVNTATATVTTANGAALILVVAVLIASIGITRNASLLAKPRELERILREGWEDDEVDARYAIAMHQIARPAISQRTTPGCTAGLQSLEDSRCWACSSSVRVPSAFFSPDRLVGHAGHRLLDGIMHGIPCNNA